MTSGGRLLIEAIIIAFLALFTSGCRRDLDQAFSCEAALREKRVWARKPIQVRFSIETRELSPGQFALVGSVQRRGGWFVLSQSSEGGVAILSSRSLNLDVPVAWTMQPSDELAFLRLDVPSHTEGRPFFTRFGIGSESPVSELPRGRDFAGLPQNGVLIPDPSVVVFVDEEPTLCFSL